MRVRPKNGPLVWSFVPNHSEIDSRIRQFRRWRTLAIAFPQSFRIQRSVTVPGFHLHLAMWDGEAWRPEEIQEYAVEPSGRFLAGSLFAG